MATRTFEIRCPIYGFVPLDEWERDIIEMPAFQRLRRVRQLGWTDAVYPGAMHTRFEHSLGVMHMATRLFDGIEMRCRQTLHDVYRYDEDGAAKQRYRRIIRLAALLHDVGHGPFSHAVEGLAPYRDEGDGRRRWRHEEYSTAIIRNHFHSVIEDHPANNLEIKAEEISGLIEGKTTRGRAAIWQELISGQLDADRMDYLLRDSYHVGVDYGKYDWRRLVNSAELVEDPESGEWRLGISDGGRHVAEGLIIARYMMFSQVYFHKTRVILDYHLQEAVKSILPGGEFPAPTSDALDEYLKWDDWRVLGVFSDGGGGDHGKRLKDRDFYRLVWETSEFPSPEEIGQLEEVERCLDGLIFIRREARKSWYRTQAADDLLVSASMQGGHTAPLSLQSGIVKRMTPSGTVRLYVPKGQRQEANERIQRLPREGMRA